MTGWENQYTLTRSFAVVANVASLWNGDFRSVSFITKCDFS